MRDVGLRPRRMKTLTLLTMALLLSSAPIAAQEAAKVLPQEPLIEMRPLAGAGNDEHRGGYLPPDDGSNLDAWYPYAEAPPFIGAGAEKLDALNMIHAGAARFLVGVEPELPAQLRADPQLGDDFVPGYYLVHFADRVDAAARELLDDLTGAVTRADGTALARWYVPNNALIAWVDSTDTHQALVSHERIDFVSPYHPAYKISPFIGAGPATLRNFKYFRLNLDLMPGHSAETLKTELARIGAPLLADVHLRGRSVYDVHFLVVTATGPQILLIAALEGVRHIQESGEGLAMYDLSGGAKIMSRTLTVDDGASSPIITAANFPLWITHDLQGQGQLIGVVDTALDWNNVGVTGCGFGFPDTAINNWGFALPNLARVLLPTVGTGGVNLKIPRADVLGGAALQGSTAGEHGTNAAGSALADFYGNNDIKWWEHDVDNWESWAPSNFSGLLGDGIAHEAQLFFTPVMNNGAFRWEFAGEFEANMNTTLDNMSAAGVCTTNHSVGLAETNNTYTQTSVTHDTNAFDHPGMLQCMAAGNSGAVANALSSQAVVKNALTVGASDDVLLAENRASFSSIGPTFDGRIKPDIMAAGTDEAPRTSGVQSLLILPNSNGTSAASCEYHYTSGTSFSSPTAAGAGALVHQYFEEGRYAGTPSILDASAALMKAMLVNSGNRLTGANLSTGAYPSSYQGWGDIQLTESLDLPGGARRLIARDVASAGGFTGAGAPAQSVAFTVNSSTQRVRVTLTWTDEPGAAGTGKKLINDLHLTVTGPSGTFLGNVFNTTTGESVTGGAADTLNNVENVIVSAPATGSWTAQVTAGLGNYAIPQGYALVITGDVVEGGAPPPAPVANFVGAPTSGNAPLVVNFTSTSTGTISSYAWNFGDSGTSTLQNPSHTYTAAGTYTVTLTVTGPGGSDAETKSGYIVVSSPPVGGPLYYLSFGASTTVPGIGTVANEDIVSYDPATGAWALVFDGSDVGVSSTDIDEFSILADGSIVMSFDTSDFALAGVTGAPSGNIVDDSDMVRFVPTSLGSTTAGTFVFYFDGSDVGLTTTNEDVDGVSVLSDGRILVSTLGSNSVTGVSGNDEDVLQFTPTSLGSVTAGTWAMYFDGSDMGLTDASSDLDAIVLNASGQLLFSTTDLFTASGLTADDEDVARFTGTFGSATSGTLTLALDLSAIGIATTADVDGLCYR
ncbi:MAG: S8 family serine peptidase [Planctomycetota bacterium]